jgi:hypothetical protein
MWALTPELSRPATRGLWTGIVAATRRLKEATKRVRLERVVMQPARTGEATVYGNLFAGRSGATTQMDLPRKAGADGLLPSEAQAPPVTERRPAEGYSGANAN